MDNLQMNVLNILGKDPRRKYYVYRLVDPRTLQTFYVGKGCDDRVFQHVRDVKALIIKDSEEDEISLKSQTIAEILSAGKEVISIIHRRGLTEKEAYEVEAALIDAYPGLTNIQRGHDSERGAISVQDLNDTFNIPIYNEPTEKYVIIKTTPQAVNQNGGLYDATRLAWRANLARARKYKYVLAVIYGVVRQVYSVDEWYQYNNDRIAFRGKVATGAMSSLVNKRIPDKYRKKGAASPFLYSQP